VWPDLITHHKTALPVWLEFSSGNSNDKKTFKPTIQAYCKLLGAEDQAYVMMDKAGFSEVTFRWIFQLPYCLDILLVNQYREVILASVSGTSDQSVRS